MTKPTFYTSLREANAARNLQWDPERKIGLLFRSTELAGEVGEACNKIKKLARAEMGLPGSRSTPYEVALELADVVICAYLAANHLGQNLDAAIVDVFNAKSVEMGFSIFMAPLTHQRDPIELHPDV